MDYTLDEMDTLQTANEHKLNEIQRINTQLTKALEVSSYSSFFVH